MVSFARNNTTYEEVQKRQERASRKKQERNAKLIEENVDTHIEYDDDGNSVRTDFVEDEDGSQQARVKFSYNFHESNYWFITRWWTGRAWKKQASAKVEYTLTFTRESSKDYWALSSGRGKVKFNNSGVGIALSANFDGGKGAHDGVVDFSMVLTGKSVSHTGSFSVESALNGSTGSFSVGAGIAMTESESSNLLTVSDVFGFKRSKSRLMTFYSSESDKSIARIDDRTFLVKGRVNGSESKMGNLHSYKVGSIDLKSTKPN
ncbi:MAG: hypothetical protein AAFY76_08325 [Cyanobacteria bacterium J06649_11]